MISYLTYLLPLVFPLKSVLLLSVNSPSVRFNWAPARAPKQSSPGPDGLSYAILALILEHPLYADLVEQVYNEVLAQSVFPTSWQQTCLCLLPKKGDLTLLTNWRPIALINTDAKAFTRLLNSRMIEASKDIINPYQTGFVHGRYIADHDMSVRLAMEHAAKTQATDIGLLLDQEKAYDRVHLHYLTRCLAHWGFPDPIVACIRALFTGTQICININGHLSEPIIQRRGVRQGDPLSPVLFNLAFEAVIQRILHDSLITGYQVRSLDQAPNPPLSSKILAYADDAFVFIHHPADLDQVLSHLQTYSSASNARINLHKTMLSRFPVLLSPSGFESFKHTRFSLGTIVPHLKH